MKEVYEEDHVKLFCLLFVIFEVSVPGRKANIHLFFRHKANERTGEVNLVLGLQLDVCGFGSVQFTVVN